MRMPPLRQVVIAAFALLVVIGLPAQAQSDVVACDPVALVAAITAANSTPAADTLNLTPGCIYAFSSAADIDPDLGDSALPRIITPIVINGNGATLARTEGSPAFRLLYVTSGGILALDRVTVTGGQMPDPGAGGHSAGGGIYVVFEGSNDGGTLTVTNSTISRNSATTGGGIFSACGKVTVTDSVVSVNRADSSSYGGNGGGISSGGVLGCSGTLTVTNSSFSDNYAGTSGGGISNSTGSTMTLSNSTLTRNSAWNATMHVEDFGGGAISNSGVAMLTENRIFGNSANYGGGIFNSIKGELTVTETTISDNGATASGGGIYNSGGVAMVSKSVIAHNYAVEVNGGGIANTFHGTLTAIDDAPAGEMSDEYLGEVPVNPFQGSLWVTDSALYFNDAGYSGGGIVNIGGAVVITNSTLFRNNANGGGGGGIHSDGGSVTLTSSTVSLNSALLNGGGILLRLNGTLDIANSVVADNTAGDSGGGIRNEGGTVTVSSSTFARNRAENGRGIHNGPVDQDVEQDAVKVTNSILWEKDTQIVGPAEVTYSIVKDGYEGEGNLDSDPLFVASGDYRLQPGSSAIDAGSNAALPADTRDLDVDGKIAEPIPFDLDGNPRIVNGTVDIGAFEAGPLTRPTPEATVEPMP